mmetsp:Transcript_46611/g.101291  ORF Transcript_46611/g.101291 Transcript_46611/m.101291 type:complete len:152 (-) Transcript_46611:729-1184(-)
MGLLKLVLPLTGLITSSLSLVLLLKPEALPPAFSSPQLLAAASSDKTASYLLENWLVTKAGLGGMMLLAPALGSKNRFWLGLMAFAVLGFTMFCDLKASSFEFDLNDQPAVLQAGVLSTLALSLLIHMFEPGLLTKDKKAKAKGKGKGKSA